MALLAKLAFSSFFFLVKNHASLTPPPCWNFFKPSLGETTMIFSGKSNHTHNIMYTKTVDIRVWLYNITKCMSAEDAALLCLSCFLFVILVKICCSTILYCTISTMDLHIYVVQFKSPNEIYPVATEVIEKQIHWHGRYLSGLLVTLPLFPACAQCSAYDMRAADCRPSSCSVVLSVTADIIGSSSAVRSTTTNYRTDYKQPSITNTVWPMHTILYEYYLWLVNESS